MTVAALLAIVLKIEVTVAVGVLVYTVTEDIVTWFADRRIAAVRERERAALAKPRRRG
jgi:uncharacterized protein (DUF2062 family)